MKHLQRRRRHVYMYTISPYMYTFSPKLYIYTPVLDFTIFSDVSSLTHRFFPMFWHQRRISMNVANDVSAVHPTTMTKEAVTKSFEKNGGALKAPTQVSGNKKSAALNDPARLSDDDDDDMEVDGVERAGSNEAGPCPPH
jgi:hypothetical protein